MFVCFKAHDEPGDGLFDGIVIQPGLRLGVLAPPSDPELGWE